MNYRYFGLLATCLLISGLVFVLYKWPQDRHKTFSQHVALQRASILYYSLLFALVLPVLLAFIIGWFTPHFAMTIWFNIFVVLASVFQLACTLVPETGVRQVKWHRVLAGVSAIFLLPALALLLPSATITGISKVIVGSGLLAMIGCIYAVAKAKGSPRNFLVIQCVYFAAFLLPLLFIAYLQ